MRDFVQNVLRALAEEKARYLLVGGIAAVIYGAPRVTVDVDIIADFDEENLKKIDSAAKKLGLKPVVPLDITRLADDEFRKWVISEKNMKVFSYINPDFPVEVLDILVDTPIDFAEAFPRRNEIEFEDFKVPVIGLDDLIFMKKKSGRGKDLADIKILEKIRSMKNE
ncbi:nucleotidyl transferase AbiEii/AbiGii toxin family protein [bacterium]|nr:nucleotidyl transferase AbiEii/AbiGii toxin family protein [bacterium]